MKRGKSFYENSKEYIPDMDALLNRDNPAFEWEWSVLFNTFYPTLYRWYRSIKIVTEWDAEEMASLAIERAYHYIHRYSKLDGSVFHSWMLRLGHNVMIDYLKSKNSKDLLVYDDNGVDLAYQEQVDERLDFELKIHHIKSNIPKIYSRPFILKEIDNMNNQEIAKALNVSIDVIPMRISRAKAYIKNELKHFEL